MAGVTTTTEESVSINKTEENISELTELMSSVLSTDARLSGCHGDQPQASKCSDNVCDFYLLGSCRFGSECKFAHPADEMVSQIKTKKKKKLKSKPKEDQYTKKKPPMKTAGDVRDRIIWDSDLPEEYFSVGYMDRFAGLVERPFMTFVWVDLCDAGPDDLAIPQHCITYFKYKGELVWDKRTRLDHVFGSTGNTVKIIEKMAKIDRDIKLKQETMNSDDDSDVDFDVDMGTSTTKNNIETEIPNRATHFLCIRVKNPMVVSEAKKVQESVYYQDPTLRNCVMPEELLHVTLSMIHCETPDAITRVEKFLDEIAPRVRALVSKNCVSNCTENQHRELCCECPSQRNIIATGLSTFGARVLYCQLDVPTSFTETVAAIHEGVRTIEGVTITNNFEFVPHMTLLKVNRPTERERRSKYMNSSLYDEYREHTFGIIHFDNIHFCLIDDMRGLDGFYLTPKHINF